MFALPTLPKTFTRIISIAAVPIFAAAPIRAADEIYESAAQGTTVTLSATADGSPSPTFQWLKEGTAIPGATNATLVLANVTTNDSAVYNALATNSAGWALSNDLILTVAVTSVAPSFTLQPYPTASAPAGTSLTLSAAAVGTPTPVYQWQKNGTAIAGATNTTVTFASLATSDSATYTVVAKNTAGTAVSNSSVLTVYIPTTSTAIPPVFTTQPVSQTVNRRDSVTFTVAASGTPAPTYQWQKNGVAIAGATNATYTIRSAATSHAGTYTAVATNSAGAVTSNGAVLTVRR